MAANHGFARRVRGCPQPIRRERGQRTPSGEADDNSLFKRRAVVVVVAQPSGSPHAGHACSLLFGLLPVRIGRPHGFPLPYLSREWAHQQGWHVHWHQGRRPTATSTCIPSGEHLCQCGVWPTPSYVAAAAPAWLCTASVVRVTVHRQGEHTTLNHCRMCHNSPRLHARFLRCNGSEPTRGPKAPLSIGVLVAGHPPSQPAPIGSVTRGLLAVPQGAS